MRDKTKEFAPTVDSNLACSLMRILDCFFSPFVPQEVSTYVYLEPIFIDTKIPCLRWRVAYELSVNLVFPKVGGIIVLFNLRHSTIFFSSCMSQTEYLGVVSA